MKAKDAIDGQLYDLPQIGDHPAYHGAECHGCNPSNAWMLFLTFNDWGERITRMIAKDAEIQPTESL